MKDPKYIARDIIAQHTEAMIQGVSLRPKNTEDLYEYMVGECAFILTEKLINGELTPMEYNDVRNELADLLWNVFEKHIKDEG